MCPSSSKSNGGLIINVLENEEYVVKSMEKSGCNWKWPKREDVLSYTKDDIIEEIDKNQ